VPSLPLQLYPPQCLSKTDITVYLSSTSRPLWAPFRSLSLKDFPVTGKDKKKEAKGVEKRTISKITNVGKTPVFGCWIQQKID